MCLHRMDGGTKHGKEMLHTKDSELGFSQSQGIVDTHGVSVHNDNDGIC